MRPTPFTPFRVLAKRSALERRCRWTRDDLENFQQEHLTALRLFALQRSPFYRRFHRGFEDRPLNELPILTKATLMENFDDLVTDRSIRLADAEAFLASNQTAELFRDRYMCCPHPAAPGGAVFSCSARRSG